MHKSVSFREPTSPLAFGRSVGPFADAWVEGDKVVAFAEDGTRLVLAVLVDAGGGDMLWRPDPPSPLFRRVDVETHPGREPQYVVVAGNPIAGVTIYGDPAADGRPWSDAGMANDWADDADFDGGEYWVVGLEVDD